MMGKTNIGRGEKGMVKTVVAFMMTMRSLSTGIFGGGVARVRWIPPANLSHLSQLWHVFQMSRHGFPDWKAALATAAAVLPTRAALSIMVTALGDELMTTGLEGYMSTKMMATWDRWNYSRS